MRRTAAWTTAVAGPALVGISLLTAAPAAAQTVDCAVYPDRCEVNDEVRDRNPVPPGDETGDRNPVAPGDETRDRNPVTPGDETRDRNPVTPGDETRDRTPGDDTSVKSTVNARVQPETLPFTGGEVVVLTLVGAGAVAGGAALVVAGRRRSASSV